MSLTESVVAFETCGNYIGRIRVDQKPGHLVKNITLTLPISEGKVKCAIIVGGQPLARVDATKVVKVNQADYIIDFESLFPGDKLPETLVTDHYKQNSPLNLQNVFGNHPGFPNFLHTMQSLICEFQLHCSVDALESTDIKCQVSYTPLEPLVHIDERDTYFLPMVVGEDVKLVQFQHGLCGPLTQYSIKCKLC